MSMESFLARTCTQTAVYWGTPVEDGRGSLKYTDAVEIKCRWEDVKQVAKSSTGKEFLSNAQVWILQDVDEDGMLYLGELDDLDSDAAENPALQDGAFTIGKFEKIPALRNVDDFVRKAYLWQRATQK